MSEWKGVLFFLRNYCLNAYYLAMKTKILTYVCIYKTRSLACILKENVVSTGRFMPALRIFTSKSFKNGAIHVFILQIDGTRSLLNEHEVKSTDSFCQTPSTLELFNKTKQNYSPYSDLA